MPVVLTGPEQVVSCPFNWFILEGMVPEFKAFEIPIEGQVALIEKYDGFVSVK